MVKMIEPMCSACGSPRALPTHIGGRLRWLCMSCGVTEIDAYLVELLGGVDFAIEGRIEGPGTRGKPMPPRPVERPGKKPFFAFLPGGLVATKPDYRVPWFMAVEFRDGCDAWDLDLLISQDAGIVNGVYDEGRIVFTHPCGLVPLEGGRFSIALGVFDTEEAAVSEAARYGYDVLKGGGRFGHHRDVSRPYRRLPILAMDYVKRVAPYLVERLSGLGIGGSRLLADDAHVRGYRACAVMHDLEYFRS